MGQLEVSYFITMKFFVLLASLALASAAPRVLKLKAGADIEHGFCGGDEGLLNIAQLSVDPYPVTVASGSSFTLAVTIDLLKEVAVGTSIKLKIVKEGLIDFPLPCLDLNGTPVGSCEYDGDFLLAAADEALCQGGYFPEGQACKLPLMAGQYGGGEPLTITLPDDLPDMIIDLLASGTYKVEIHANNGGSELVCAWVRLELQGA